ncbi:MAG TPA: hypothetical protein VHU89_02015 [Acidobacteriaceae bacterium]|nr:hypothetical protein [Acidobacteriaceae bacterium]
MDQKQLQFARAALWHQTAPLQTADEATTWLEDLGLCLFLPRHAQLPAPAPSFVEAVHGAASAAPPAAALEHAGELVTRLVDDDRIMPLNLLGTYSEQADFLITPEVLPWVAAVRGDRQWNTAPGGRTSPLVIRAWQVLDREGEATAVQLRELLGRELTEAAVLRALIELWTTVRAMPVYKLGEPTRWTLLKNRFPAQLTTGANTAQTTALSALLSIYLRSAVAATAGEAEIFLSPLTARSRIREVIHGMMAARQFGSMSVAAQTLLFVEGSLPENLPVEPEVAEAAAPAMARRGERAQRAPGPPFRKAFQDKRGRGEFGDKRGPSHRPDGPRQETKPPFKDKRPEEGGAARPWQRRPEFHRPDRPAGEERPAADSRFGARGQKRPPTGFRPGTRGEKRPGTKPWERRPPFPRPERPVGEERPPDESRAGARSEKRPGFRPGPRGEKRPATGFRPGPRGEKRPATGFRSGPRGEKRPPTGFRPGPRSEKRPSTGFRPGPRGEKRPSTGFQPGPRGEKRPATGFRPGPRGEKPGPKPWERRPATGERREEKRRPFDREGGERPPRVEKQSGEKTGQRSGPASGQRSGPRFPQKGGFRPGGPKSFGGKKPGAKPFGSSRPKFPPKREGAPAGARSSVRARGPGFGKPPRREGSGRSFAQGKNFKGPGKKIFRKAGAGERNPRKNRSQDENPE